MGTRVSNALGRTLALVVLATAGCAGGPGDSGNTATWSVSGARSEYAEHDDDEHYVSCTLTDSRLLDMTSSALPGVDPWLTVRISSYWGPGSFEFEYAPGPLTASADVRLPGDYSYWFFYNGSFATETPSRCSMDVTEPVPGERLHAEISCTNLVAQITSPDYESEDPSGFRPAVSLTATFDCEI